MNNIYYIFTATLLIGPNCFGATGAGFGAPGKEEKRSCLASGAGSFNLGAMLREYGAIKPTAPISAPVKGTSPAKATFVAPTDFSNLPDILDQMKDHSSPMYQYIVAEKGTPTVSMATLYGVENYPLAHGIPSRPATKSSKAKSTDTEG